MLQRTKESISLRGYICWALAILIQRQDRVTFTMKHVLHMVIDADILIAFTFITKNMKNSITVYVP